MVLASSSPMSGSGCFKTSESFSVLFSGVFILWSRDIEVFADFLGGKIYDFTMSRDDRAFLRGTIYVDCVASTFAQKFTAIALEVFN